MEKISIAYIESPIGWLKSGANENGILFVSFEDEKPDPISVETNNLHLNQLINELSEYFEGKRTSFEVPISFSGTKFQNKVWKELLTIPYGQTISYKQQTLKLGDEKAIRAVATANGKNKHAIIVPCHRVVGSDGSLTGYAGGLWRKKWLLEFEAGKIGKPFQQELFKSIQ